MKKRGIEMLEQLELKFSELVNALNQAVIEVFKYKI